MNFLAAWDNQLASFAVISAADGLRLSDHSFPQRPNLSAGCADAGDGRLRSGRQIKAGLRRDLVARIISLPARPKRARLVSAWKPA